MLVSCSGTAQDQSEPSNTEAESGISFENIDLTGKTITIFDRHAFSYQIGETEVKSGFFDYEKLEEMLGCTIDLKTVNDNVLYTKILAGDSDIDIYVVSSDEAKLLSEAGALHAMQSQSIKDFNSKCFDSLQEFSINENGETVLMPISIAVNGLFAPKSAVEELGITEDDVRYLYDYLDVVKNYDGSRKVYSSPNLGLFNEMDDQYGLTYCDYENGVFDYNTEVYKKYYSTLLDGWSDYNGDNPWYSTRDSSILMYSTDRTLFYYGIFGTKMDLQDYPDDWTVFPAPKLDENVEKFPAYGTFLCINPNSLQLEEAERFLEVISENYYSLFEGKNEKSNLIFKDLSMYPNSDPDGYVYVDTDSEIFKKYIEIANETVVFDGVLSSSMRDDIIGYQNGTYTLDEAIDVRSREVDVMLNE